jgi:uncharacterized membrane protein
MRGLALVLMALEHASWSCRVNVVAERYRGVAPHLADGPFFATGFLCHLAAPTFWLLAGVSVTLFADGHARKGATQAATTRFLLIRGLVLLLLDATFVAVYTGSPGASVGYEYAFDVLSGLGVTLALLAFLRRLSSRTLLLGALAVLLIDQILIRAAPVSPGPGAFFAALWFDYLGTGPAPHVFFPVLGWGVLSAFGVVLGRCVTRPWFTRPAIWVAAGAALIALWAVARFGDPTDLAPHIAGEPWVDLIVMSKGPPAFDYLAFNLGLAALSFAGILAVRDAAGGAPLRLLVVFGQASLFFYVLHLYLYKILGAVAGRALASMPELPRFYLVAAAGLLILWPLCARYRALRRRHPDSLLRFL